MISCCSGSEPQAKNFMPLKSSGRTARLVEKKRTQPASPQPSTTKPRSAKRASSEPRIFSRTWSTSSQLRNSKGRLCMAATVGSISRRPTTDISAPCSWPMRMRRAISASPPWLPSVNTVKRALPPCAARQLSPSSSRLWW